MMKTTTFEELTCCACGTTYQIEEHLNSLRKKDGMGFYCPNGHSQHYTVTDASEIKRLRTEVAELSAHNGDLEKEVRELKCDLMAIKLDKSLLQKIKEKWA